MKSEKTTSKAEEALGKAHAETLQLLFKGLTTREISELRHRAPKTIEHQIHDLMQKVGARNSRELIHEALYFEWLQPPRQS